MSNELEAFLEYISVTKALSQKSVEAYMSDLASIEEELNSPLIKLDTKAILSFLIRYTNKRTLNRKLSSLNAFFDFCYKSHFSEQKAKHKFAKIPKLLPKFLSYIEIQNSLKLIDKNSWLGFRDYALLIFLYASGARISECLELELQDIEDGWLRIRHAKGDKERVVPIAKVALMAIAEYIRQKPKETQKVWVYNPSIHCDRRCSLNLN